MNTEQKALEVAKYAMHIMSVNTRSGIREAVSEAFNRLNLSPDTDLAQAARNHVAAYLQRGAAEMSKMQAESVVEPKQKPDNITPVALFLIEQLAHQIKHHPQTIMPIVSNYDPSEPDTNKQIARVVSLLDFFVADYNTRGGRIMTKTLVQQVNSDNFADANNAADRVLTDYLSNGWELLTHNTMNVGDPTDSIDIFMARDVLLVKKKQVEYYFSHGFDTKAE